MQETAAGVIEDCAIELAHEEHMILLEVERLADGMPTELAGIRPLLRQLGLCTCAKEQHNGDCSQHPICSVERGCSNAVEALLQAPVGKRPDELAHASQSPGTLNPGVDLGVWIVRQRQHLGGDWPCWVIEERFGHRVWSHRQHVRHRRVIAPEPERTNQHQPVDTSSEGGRDLSSHQAAKGMPHNGRDLQPKPVEELIIGRGQRLTIGRGETSRSSSPSSFEQPYLGSGRV
jgi:hypothetical protein